MQRGASLRRIDFCATQKRPNRALHAAGLGEFNQGGQRRRVDKAFRIVEVQLIYGQAKLRTALGVIREKQLECLWIVLTIALSEGQEPARSCAEPLV
jgi:hypothetical protein